MSTVPQPLEPLPPILIVSRSARMLAEAASGSWSPRVIDMFADEDTRAVAERWRATVPMDSFMFSGAVIGEVEELSAGVTRMPIVLGSGFESGQDWLDQLRHYDPTVSHVINASKRLSDLPAVLASLQSDVGVCVPETRCTPPVDCRGWLRKLCRESGGFHVVPALGADAESRAYFQRHVRGSSLSAIFLASSRRTEFVALNRHLTWQQDQWRGYHYQGAVTWHSAPAPLVGQVRALGSAVGAALGLRGMFGLDFVLAESGSLMLIDINPRPPATLDLLVDRSPAFDAHVAACALDMLLYSRPERTGECAHLILYAQAQWQVPEDFAWPESVHDRPSSGTHIEVGDPLCSIRANAATPTAICKKLVSLVRRIRALTVPALLPENMKITLVGDAIDG